MSAQATICPICKSWQSRWKNYLVFLGGSAGVLVLIVTAATYIASTAYVAISEKDDAEVLQLQYPGYQVFANSGTVPVLLSHLELYWRGGSTTIALGQQLAPQQMYYKTDDLGKLKAAYPSATLVANVSGDGTALLSQASPFPYMNKCYSMVFFSTRAPEMLELQTFFSPGNVKLATAKLGAAYLFYYATNNVALRSKQFSAVAAFLDLKKKECSLPDAVQPGRSSIKPPS
jgi:hypothetical protein